ncbi:MAG: translation initiation factor IF-2 [Cocleimonas sp.]|jgi:translation initiation factor IF-2
MSDIIVKQLAELIGAPVDSLLQQLKDADITVSGPDDSITDRQKLKLLEFIRTGQATTSDAAPKKAGGKISLKRRSSTEIKGAQGKSSVSVEVRRKKNFTRTPTTTDVEVDTNEIEALEASSNRTSDLSEQLSNERKAREDAMDKNKADREATSERKTAEKSERDAAKLTAEESAEIEVVPAETTTEETVVEETPAVEVPAVEVVAEVPAKPAPLVLPKDPKERREFLAKRARDEAASKFKRRPSPVRPTPKPLAVSKPAVTTPAKATTTNAAPGNNANKGKKKPFQGRNSGPGQLHVREGLSGKRKKKGKRTRNVKIEQSTEHGFVAPTEPVTRSIQVPDTIVVSELAQMLSVKGADVIRAMMGMGVMATINQVVDQDTAILIVEEMGHEATPAASEEEKSSTENLLEDTSGYDVSPRAPVVTIMGHVDHGKTSLLDYIRNSRVASGEAGGITQHIGAYQVETENGIVSFLDTPGHAAFSQMRARGAQATDIVILVVAADDGVMPQTEEAIKHTRAAGVPLIVAINKIDKESADPEKVKSGLTSYEVVPEEWGGEDVFVNVSALTGEGIDKLLEAVLLVAEVKELKARTEGPAKGTVVESSVVKGRGAVATILVQEGTLKKGDIVLAGSQFGRIRAISDDLGKSINEAGPSTPVEILGLSGTPSAGDDLIVLKSERRARELATQRHEKERETRFAAQQAAKLDAMFEKMQDGEKSTLNVLLKADVQGSLEAIKSSLNALSTDEVVVNIISSGVGGLSETDISLAQSSEAVIIGFNVRADASARRFAQESDTEIRYYSIIYELIDDVRDAMSGLLKPELREEMVGIAEVKDVFTGSGFGNIAGCMVTEGKVKKDLPIRVLRKDVVIYEGYLESLRRHQDDVKEVVAGTECGIGVKNYDDVQPGDQIEAFTRTEIERKLEK